MVVNRCYDSDCINNACYNPEHFNFICFDPNCDDDKCLNPEHYNKQLLYDYQEGVDLSIYDHSEKIDYNEDVEISLCGCPDCTDDHNHSHGHNHEDNHGHGHHGYEDSCGHDHEDNHGHGHHGYEDSCGHDHEDNHGHGHHGYEDSCGHDHGHNHDKELLAEGKPLIYNRPIQIILSSGILFFIGHILELISFNSISINVIFMLAAVIAGYQIAIMAFKSLFKRFTVGPALLMVIACVASFIIGHPEEGAAVAFLYYIAEFLEDYAEHRAKHSIKSLVEIAPETARVKVGDGEEIRKTEDIKLGEIVIVKPGDKVPLDGKVVYGSSSINQASITGESLPVVKYEGDEVFSGTINQEGYLEVVVTKESKDTVISKIVTLVKRAQLNKANTETMVEKIAKYYTPIMIVIAACVAFVPHLLFNQDLTSWVYRALSIMVISCPCAFLISTPIGMVSAITSATRKGVLVKGSSYIEEMRNIKAVIFDKTGTLTEGKFELSDIDVLNNKYSVNDVIKIAASLESHSNHPIAMAIINHANLNDIEFEEITDFKNISGKGIVGKIEGKMYYAANESLIEGSEFELSNDFIKKYSSEGKTVVFVGDEKNIIASITVSDKIRDNSAEVISNLKKHGVKSFMLTGDNSESANKVANEIGIDYVYSNLLPEDKLNILDTIRNKFGDVAMLGDGVNDAPALARANIGIAMGAAGSDVAIETADIALMQDDISKLPYLFNLSNKTMGIIKQNISISIFIKVLFVILAILGLITLMMSVSIGDLGLTFFVILNSFRIGIVKDALF